PPARPVARAPPPAILVEPIALGTALRQSFPQERRASGIGVQATDPDLPRIARGAATRRSRQGTATPRSNDALRRGRRAVDEPPLEQVDSSALFAAPRRPVELPRSFE